MNKDERSAILGNRQALTKLVADADMWLASLTHAFAEADMTEKEINEACTIATRAVIAKAAITSMNIMKDER